MDELKKRTTEVLLTTAIIVRTRANEDGGSPFVEQMSDRLLAAIESAFSADPDARPTNTVGYHWLGSAATNSGVCVRCGRWATDRNQPNTLNALPEAVLVEGSLVCDQCRTA